MEKGQFKTKKGYDFYEVSSAMQKAIRRGDAKIAGFCALELFHSGYKDYVWKRLLTISAEDCWGILTQEVMALYEAFKMVNKNNEKGRIFISKAVILLSTAKKCRDADHLQNFIYDKELLEEDEINKYLEEMDETIILPEYTYDCHTMKGKKKGKTKKDFFQDEYNALNNRQLGLFDYVIESIEK